MQRFPIRVLSVLPRVRIYSAIFAAGAALCSAIVGCGADDAAAGTGVNLNAQSVGEDHLTRNRDRLLESYLGYLKEHPTRQSNGLLGSELTNACDLWTKLAPSPQQVFLTLTARLEGSKLVADGTSMLDHVTKVYRLVGGDGATATTPGSCGGGEANRMIMSMDESLHAELVKVNTTQGKVSGRALINDVPTKSNDFWRDSHDLGGAHAPFDMSDETDPGAPRGQVQFFKDEASPRANAALGRQDLHDLVDPNALEMDQDYDCPHNSNPACAYTNFKELCFPSSAELGTKIYADNYGPIAADWQPASCAQ